MSKVMKIFFVIAYISFLGFLLSDGWAVEYNAFLGIKIKKIKTKSKYMKTLKGTMIFVETDGFSST